MKKFLMLALAALLATAGLHAQRNRQKTPDPVIPDSLYSGLKWRNIGPFRGGRSVAACGVVDQPGTYYMGSTGGGIWKTTDNGITWKNVSDGFLKTGTVGDISVSASDPNVVLVGMGEHAARGVMTSMGDGVYLSKNAGATWEHIGLSSSRHISDVIIHPADNDTFYVAAQGAQYGPGGERGVYRTTDGGQTWEQVLYVNEHTGAASLSMDPTNPRILYAAMWQHRRFPWTMESGGAGSGLYKSSDGGTSWEKLTEGLPEMLGKAGISASGAKPGLVYAVLEAEGEKAGVYRSDDGGKSWRQVSKDRINVTRSWYYMEIFADPQDPERVYVLNAPVTRSIDGGKTFQPLPTPHGDNHDLWINPQNNNVMINANDGGANISVNGGQSWSTQENQPTAQFYRVITDNQFPYYVYGGQQDNSAIAIKSRTGNAGIDWKDWYSVAGCESAYLAFDPDNPEVVYGGCYQGIIEKWLAATREAKQIQEYPELGLGKPPGEQKYRYNWNAPIISDPFDRGTIYHAGNVVFRSSDGGMSWEVISPDLTRNDPEKHGPGGKPFTNEAAGGENYNTIMYLTASPTERGTLWAGSDDGLVHITRNGGQSWDNITPEGMQEGIVNSIEVSPHDPATAYVTLMRYKFMDLKPYVYKTTDHGASWTLITRGFDDPNGFVRVVREDPVRPGLLYAGTETGLYLSLNGGASWQPFQLNLPVVPVNDLGFRNNDLIAATAGRAFWILDDLSPLQQAYDLKAPVTLIRPRETVLFTGGSQEEPRPGLGQNPKSGVILDYYLAAAADSTELTLEILENGEVIRKYSNQKPKEFKSWPGGPSKPEVLGSKAGLNRFVWDFHRESLPAVDGVFVLGDYSGSRVAPGNYSARIRLGSEEQTQPIRVLPRPDLETSPEAYREQQAALAQIEGAIRDMHEAVNRLRSVKGQLESYAKLLSDREEAEPLLKMGDSLLQRITDWEEALIQPQQKTFQDVINYRNQLNAELMYLKDYVGGPVPELTAGARQRLRDLMAQWNTLARERDAIADEGMAAYNRRYRELDLPALILD
ncbi:glycosyl hydrolase [Robiginitalea sp. SC105]|uniref:WD40/YVTN/BNR-like repeat-containing protein n=1 Tax=Robiginitalea sp. SC105 TaxID=2762332 RepID=UPI00163A2207|nr:glycosyl hydrolase [Robiginitalea sp. SC105]MBC2838499.1 glycosyl hydrolase [Robiginitalea sp. SC105]